MAVAATSVLAAVAGARRAGEPVPRRPRRPLPASGVIGSGVLVVLVLTALSAQALAGDAIGDLSSRLTPPLLFGGGLDHPLGTDHLGRDLLERTALAARASLLIAGGATLLAGLLGVALGLVSGYAPPWLDLSITWLMDVQQSLPFIVLAIGLTAARGQSVENVVAVLALSGWVTYARIVRLSTAALRRADFVEAARVGGATTPHILVRHLLPNVAPSVVVVAAQLCGAMLVYEAGLTFLGLGVPSGTLTWGGLVADGRELLLPAWWVSTLPGIALIAAVLALSLVGDWLNDALLHGA